MNAFAKASQVAMQVYAQPNQKSLSNHATLQTVRLPLAEVNARILRILSIEVLLRFFSYRFINIKYRKHQNYYINFQHL